MLFCVPLLDDDTFPPFAMVDELRKGVGRPWDRDDDFMTIMEEEGAAELCGHIKPIA